MKKIRLSWLQGKKAVWNRRIVRVKQCGGIFYVSYSGFVTPKWSVTDWLGNVYDIKVYSEYRP